MRLKRAITVFVLVAALVAAVATPAYGGLGRRQKGAPPSEGDASNNGNNGAQQEVNTPGTPGASGGGDHAINHGDPCAGGQTYSFRPTSPSLNAQLHEQYGTVPAAGSYVYMRCGNGPEDIVWSRNLDATPGDIARSMAETVEPPAPNVRFSPDGNQIVGVDTWLWIENWGPITPDPLTFDGVTVAVTFTPEKADWNMGDGTTVPCTDGGTPYDRNRPSAEQSTSCKHTYKKSSAEQPNERYRGEVTITWTATFTVSNEAGTQQIPGTFTSSSPFSLRVAESQALVG